MRYYRIDITDPTTGAPLLPSSLGGFALSSILPNGAVNPAALNIEFDIPVTAQHLPDASATAYLRIWGLSIKDIGNAYNLNPTSGTGPGAQISLYAGMSKGLPLANPQQQGLIAMGSVKQAYGNWIGIEQTLDIQLAPPSGSYLQPAPFVINWQSGQGMDAALRNTFSVALPSAMQNITISPRLVRNYTGTGYYDSLAELSNMVNTLSRSIITDPGYPGVTITYDGTTISATDFTGPQSPAIVIAPQDIIGQPTWRGTNQIQIKTVMRGNIQMGDVVSIPPSLATNSLAALTAYTNPGRSVLSFSGNFLVQTVHYYGNFRAPDAASWNTTFDLVPVAPS